MTTKTITNTDKNQKLIKKLREERFAAIQSKNFSLKNLSLILIMSSLGQWELSILRQSDKTPKGKKITKKIYPKNKKNIAKLIAVKS